MTPWTSAVMAGKVMVPLGKLRVRCVIGVGRRHLGVDAGSRQLASLAASSLTLSGFFSARLFDSLWSRARLKSSKRPFSKNSASFQSTVADRARGPGKLVAVVRIVPVEGPRLDRLPFGEQPGQAHAVEPLGAGRAAKFGDGDGQIRRPCGESSRRRARSGWAIGRSRERASRLRRPSLCLRVEAC